MREDDSKKVTERKLLEAKVNDQYKFAITKNKITHTDFLNASEKNIAEKFLRESHIKQFLFWGGNGEASDRNILIFYPEKFSQEMVEKNYSKIVSGIRIQLPKECEYEHRVYLSGIMKLGIKREKIGDILVQENGADIVVLNEVAEFVKNNLESLTRFSKAKCTIIPIKEIRKIEKKYEILSVIVSSMRLDSFVSELARTSRNKSLDIINEQRVFVNYELETKFSKKINLGDVITIRGKGKFIVDEISHKTRSEKYAVSIKKFV